MKPRRFDWYPVDWLDGVATMPPDQRGVYDTIINLIYAHAEEDGSIEMDERELAHRCCCHWRELRRILGTLVAQGKVSQDGRKIWIKRCAEEVQRARTRGAQRPHKSSETAENNNIPSPACNEHAPARVGDNHQPSAIKEEKPSLSGGKKTASPKREVTTDWRPDEAGESYAKDKAGWIDERLGDEVEGFVIYHRKHGNRFADIGAAWQTWVRNGAKIQAERGNTRRGAAPPVEAMPLAYDEDEHWRVRLRVWLDPEKGGPTRQRWIDSAWGPPPGQPGCRVPRKLLQEFEFTQMEAA